MQIYDHNFGESWPLMQVRNIPAWILLNGSVRKRFGPDNRALTAIKSWMVDARTMFHNFQISWCIRGLASEPLLLAMLKACSKFSSHPLNTIKPFYSQFSRRLHRYLRYPVQTEKKSMLGTL